MTKADLVEAVYEIHGGLSRAEAAEIVDGILRRIRRGLVRDGRVQIAGFGRLQVVRRKARPGRNPRTGQRLELPARETVVLKPSSGLVDVLQSRPDEAPGR